MVDRSLRIVFMGTPDFSVPSLQYLKEAGYQIVGIVTAPDKMGGRGMKQVISSPVKKYAVENNIPVAQPEKLRDPNFLSMLKEWNADIQVVVAFRMLPQLVWNMPRLGTINLHGSLLPAYRGAAPIQWAIIRGEDETGITTFRLQHEIDSGEILLQERIAILESDNTSTLHDRMQLRGAGLVLATMDAICSNTIEGKAQNSDQVTHAPKLTRENTRIQWSESSTHIQNLIRGLSPYPGAWSILDDQEIKVFSSKRLDEKSITGGPGEIESNNSRLLVKTGEGVIEILELQLAGKKRMSTKEFLNGYKIKTLKLL